jgi:hypothetical protein
VQYVHYSGSDSLVHHTLDAIETHLQDLQLGAVRESDEVMAGAVKQITTTRGVEVEEDARHDNHLLLQAGLEEVQAVGDGAGETLEVQPTVCLSATADATDHGDEERDSQVESGIGHVFDDEAHLTESAHDHVSLVLDGGQPLGILVASLQ